MSEAKDGKATVVEFIDYQCPACGAYYQNITGELMSSLIDGM